MDARLLRRVACPASGLQTTASASCTMFSSFSSSSSSSVSSASASASSISRLIPASLAAGPAVLPASRRYQSTRNRTKRALNIAPHASFAVPGSATLFRPNKHATGSASSEGATAAVLGTISSPASGAAAATILYNPPASAPSVYQTPFKFLPKCDPRRVLNISSMFQAAAAGASPSPSAATAPKVNVHYKPTEKYHLSEADVAEMRQLRAEDPVQWSVLALARKYKCSAVFVMLATKGQAGEEHTAANRARLEAVKERWGPIRTKARVERTKRRELLYSGEI